MGFLGKVLMSSSLLICIFSKLEANPRASQDSLVHLSDNQLSQNSGNPPTTVLAPDHEPTTTAEDPHTCTFIEKELHCDDPKVANECANLCTKGEDLHTCSLLEPAVHCKIQNIAKECPKMCAIEQLRLDEVVEDPPVCAAFDPFEDCENPIVIETCKNLCNSAVCVPGCSNGVCSDPNTCTCSDGWTGELCDKPVCVPGCSNGVCSDPNTCTCSEGWTGELCDKPVCVPGCSNGVCSDPNTCTCSDGWAGELCDKPVCEPTCGNGKCVAPFLCRCPKGWFGYSCQYPICQRPCINGKCIAPDSCQCDPGWTDEQCNKCNPRMTGEQCSKCNPRMTGEQCNKCNPGWTGEMCDSCATGFFGIGSSACYRFYNDAEINWADAVSKCADENLQLAEPTDEEAVELRSYLVDTYGDGKTWLGAQGSDSRFMWRVGRDGGGTELRTDNSLWYPGHPGSYVTTANCLRLQVYKSNRDSYPDKPYASTSCSTSYNTLCEAIP